MSNNADKESKSDFPTTYATYRKKGNRVGTQSSRSVCTCYNQSLPESFDAWKMQHTAHRYNSDYARLRFNSDLPIVFNMGMQVLSIMEARDNVLNMVRNDLRCERESDNK